jgi:hypothetical protein
MGIYALFVLLSYAFSDYKEFSILGYNGRFEGTLVILAYLLMLFYTINAVNSEKNVKAILVCVAASCTLLCLLGFSQGTGHDFFRTTIGKKLILPVSQWENLDSLNFTFNNNEIYQTVYNINYVSFYLALIIPIFAMLMIYALNNIKKSKGTAVLGIALAVFFAALIYNLAGSKSAGGIAGLAVAFVCAVVLFNKRLIKWWKSIAVMVVVMMVMMAATSSLWLPEITGTFSGMKSDTVTSDAVSDTSDSESGTDDAAAAETSEEESADAGATVVPYIDYIETDGFIIRFSVEGNELDVETVIDAEQGAFETLSLTDSDGNTIGVKEVPQGDTIKYAVMDDRFYDYLNLYLTKGEDDGLILVLCTVDKQWPFAIQSNGVFYRNGFGKLTSLEKVKEYGFKNNPSFGSGRGFIWSTTLGMLGDNIVIGDGADTYCINYPHNNYAGKYNAKWDNQDLIVDKPHNMYLNMFQGTGGISVLAFIAMMVIYLIQSIKALHGVNYTHWIEYAASGIFLGVIGFLVGGIFNDSTVSTMPLFYTMLGTGIAVNILLEHKKKEVKSWN